MGEKPPDEYLMQRVKELELESDRHKQIEEEIKPTVLNSLIQHENRMFGSTKKEIRIHEKDLLWPEALNDLFYGKNLPRTPPAEDDPAGHDSPAGSKSFGAIRCPESKSSGP